MKTRFRRLACTVQDHDTGFETELVNRLKQTARNPDDELPCVDKFKEMHIKNLSVTVLGP
jgi:hypothetical protein